MILGQVEGVLQIVMSVGLLQFVKVNQVGPTERERDKEREGERVGEVTWILRAVLSICG